MKVLLGFCIFAACAGALSEESVSSGSKDEPAQESKARKIASTGKQSAEQHSISVKIAPGPETKTDTDNKPRFGEAKPTEDRTIEIVSIAITAIATCVMALFTISLARSTKKLWIESKAAGVIAQTTASAALRAAEVAEKSLVSTERAFVFLKYAYASPVFDIGNRITGWDIHVVWENAGPTPTQNMNTYKNLFHFPNGMPDDFTFPDIVSGSGSKSIKKTFIGPRAIVDAGAQFVPLVILNAASQGEGKLYCWGWVEYGDVFRKDIRSRSEYCFEVVINGRVDQPPTTEIKPPFSFVNYGIHSGSEDECYRRPGQEIPILRLPA